MAPGLLYHKLVLFIIVWVAYTNPDVCGLVDAFGLAVHPKNTRPVSTSAKSFQTTSYKLLPLFLAKDDTDKTSDETSTRQSTAGTNSVSGLLPEPVFQRQWEINQAINNLRRHLPSLLQRPLTENVASGIYAADTKLIIRNKQNAIIELAESRAELISISETILLATAFASNTATSLLLNFVTNGETPDTERNLRSRITKCNVIVTNVEQLRQLKKKDDIVLEVEWEANVLPGLRGIFETRGSVAKESNAYPKSRSYDLNRNTENERSGQPVNATQQSSSLSNQVLGLSRFTLDNTADYKVSSHQLLNIRVNDVNIDPATIGQSLSLLRQTTQMVSRQASSAVPFLSQATSIFNQVKNEVLAQQVVENDQSNTLIEAPIFIIQQQINTSAVNNTDVSNRVSIDDYTQSAKNSNQLTFKYLLPGSLEWTYYSFIHQITNFFVRYIIPTLSGNINEKSLFYQNTDYTCFAPQAQLIATDKSVLLRDAASLENFYKSIASLRKISRGSWNITNSSIIEYHFQKDRQKMVMKIQIEYSSSLGIPATGPVSPFGNEILFKGTDVYVLSARLPKYNDLKNYYDSMHEWDSILQIERVEQKQLQLSGGPYTEALRRNLNSQDSTWLMKHLVTGIESGSLRSLDSSTSFLLDILQQLRDPRSILASTITSNREKENVTSIKLKAAPRRRRSDDAALMAYRIMETLHRDVPKLSQPMTSDYTLTNEMKTLVPSYEYLDENVKLLGYFDEELARGKTQYLQSIGLMIGTLQAAIGSGSVISDKEPLVMVELTSKGNIRFSSTFSLRANPMPFGNLPGLVTGNKPFGVIQTDRLPPINIQLVSEYVLSTTDGRVVKHRLIESRVNGQLTPGGVISRWIQQLGAGISPSLSPNKNDVDNPNGETISVQNLVRDWLSWILTTNK